MTWVALVGPEEEENLSLRYLASSLEASGLDSEIVPFNASLGLSEVLNSILSAPQPPAVIGLSLAFQWRAKDFLALAIALKEQGYTGHITAGGHFGSFACRELLADFPEIDSICLHEAEQTMVSLTRAVVSKSSLENIAGLAHRDPQGQTILNPMSSPPDLDGLPWPNRHGEPEEWLGHSSVPIVGSRGCYASCAFCCIAAWHALSPSGKRFRTRDVDDIADEIAWLSEHRGAEIFTFHDDNFFVPGEQRSLERINALADAIEDRHVGRIGTVIKARPTDITPEILKTVRDRLGCMRTFLGIESASEQGLRTMTRGVTRQQIDEAMRIASDLGVFVCFNMLIFDPDTTVESLEDNLAFMEEHADSPLNFGRVELYAGTPLLERMQKEKRCAGDYLGWDYRLASPEVHRIFKIFVKCFDERNFASEALANHLQGTRFQVEVCRHFHADVFQDSWLSEVKKLSKQLACDSAAGLREIMEFAQTPKGDAPSFVSDLSRRLRRTEDVVRKAAHELEQTLQQNVCASSGHQYPRGVVRSG